MLSNLLDIIGDYEQEFKNLNLICKELKIDPKKIKKALNNLLIFLKK